MNIRQFRWEDLPAIVDLMNRHAQAFGSAARVTLEQVERSWRAPYNHPDQTAFVAEQPDGQIIGYTIADLLDDPHFANGVYQVLPGFADASRALVQAATDYFLSVAPNTLNVRVTMEWHLSAKDTDAIGLFEADGYQQVRQFYTMRIALEQPIDAVPLPNGFTLRPFTADQLERVYEAKVEAFQDHWGEQHDPLHEWRSDIAVPHFDPTLWWVAYEGDHVAGMVLSQPRSHETGWVGIVGVPPTYRRRGLAQALLQKCFAEYQRRGYQQVDLGVDSDSQTNAVALYQRVGMHIHRTILFYRKVLRDAAPHANPSP